MRVPAVDAFEECIRYLATTTQCSAGCTATGHDGWGRFYTPDGAYADHPPSAVVLRHSPIFLPVFVCFLRGTAVPAGTAEARIS